MESEKWENLKVLGMKSENFWIFGSFRNGILFFLWGGESDLSDSSDVSDKSDWSDYQLVDS